MVKTEPSLAGVKVVLLDIEGTICPISWVKETLADKFPYAIEALPEVLRTKWDDACFAPYKDDFPIAARISPKALERHVRYLTKKDVKIAYLKNLQGYLWQTGFESKAYSAPLFNDVLPALERWRKEGKRICIYSSGSVFAQKLLFGHIKDMGSSDTTATVDQRGMVEAWFDTLNAGPKTVRDSYERIAGQLEVGAKTIIFLSDNVKEIKAAQDAGLKAIMVDRPGNAELSVKDREDFSIIENFQDIGR